MSQARHELAMSQGAKRSQGTSKESKESAMSQAPCEPAMAAIGLRASNGPGTP